MLSDSWIIFHNNLYASILLVFDMHLDDRVIQPTDLR